MILRKPYRWLLLALLALLLAACGSDPEPTPAATEAPAATEQVAASTPTLAPVVTTEAPDDTTDQSPASSFMGVALQAENLFGGFGGGELVPAEPLSPGPGAGGGNPETIRIRFGQSLDDFVAPTQPQILVYPVEDFRRLFDEAGNRIDALNTLLANRPAAVEEALPLLPIFNAAEVFHTQLSYLDFANGSGIRFLSHYAQAPVPITDEVLFYTFQGLTDDGRFYIAAFFPVGANILPPDPKEFDADILNSAESWQAYLATIVRSLNGLSSDDFTPELNPIDTVIQSLDVRPENFPSPVKEAGFTLEETSFVYDTSLADEISGEKIPAQLLGVDGPPVFYEEIPDYARITWALGDRANKGQLVIQPIKDQEGQYYAELSDQQIDDYEALSAQLIQQPANPGGSLAHIQYLSFFNGQGVRSLQYVPQELGPVKVTNQNLGYVFEGLTEDGRYYISFNYNVASPTLPDDGNFTDEEFTAAAADFDAYLDGVILPLNDVAGTDFNPDLALLDDFVKSLVVFLSETTTVIVDNPTDCLNDATFLADVTIPDGTIIEPGASFVKSWQMANIGTCTWDSSYRWAFVSGEQFDWPDSLPFFGVVQPGGDFEVSVNLTAPTTPGSYQGYWQMQAPDGTLFGPEVYLLIEVAQEPTPTPEPTGPIIAMEGTVVLFASSDKDNNDVNTYLDLDSGATQVPATADVQLTIISGTNALSYTLELANSALLAVVGADEPGFEGCTAATYGAAPAGPEALALGNYLCVRTGDGRFAQLQIIEVGDIDENGLGFIRVSFVTWERGD